MVAAPALPDGAAEAAGGADSVVPGLRTWSVFQPWPGVLACRYDGAGAARRDGGMAGAGVIGPVSTYLADGLLGRDLVQ